MFKPQLLFLGEIQSLGKSLSMQGKQKKENKENNQA